MTTISTLLTLPTTSNAFSKYRSSAIETVDLGSASPRRKVPRLSTDSDSASASRSSTTTQKVKGSTKIEIIGEDVGKPDSTYQWKPYGLVKSSIRTLLTRNTLDPLPASKEKIYRACRFVVTVEEKGKGLYDILKMELEECVKRLATSFIDSMVDTGIKRLSVFVEICKWFEKQIMSLKSLLTYLDQVYVPAEPNAAPVRDLAYSFFSDFIFLNPQVAERLREDVEEWVTWERQSSLRKSIPEMQEFVKYLLVHKQYSAFEEYYVNLTRNYYVEESAALAEKYKDDAKAFFKEAKGQIEREIALSEEVLHPGSCSLITEVTENSLWDKRLEWVANETLGPYMASKDLTALAAMYSLFARVDASKVLLAAFRAYLRKSVETIVKDQAHDDEMVQRLLELKQFADKSISNAFVDEPIPAPISTTANNNQAASTSAPLPKVPNQEFIYALSDAFTQGFKARRNKPAEMIAKYLDKQMRKGQGSSTDTQFEDLLDSVLALYRFTDDKDVFRTFYHRSLAKRLLLEKSASDDFEIAMLKKLKYKYDPDFDMGENMFNDLSLSRDAMADYHSKPLPKGVTEHKLNAMVLQRSAWPFADQKAKVDLPPKMQAELTAFTEYYKTKHPARVLSWDHALGTAILKARFKEGTKELSVSLYQAIILLLFNDTSQISFKDLKEETGIEEAELRRTLQSLACGKKKVLKKMPSGKEVEDRDVFRFNDDFTDPRAKVHINSIQAKVSPEESKRTNLSIEGDRKHYLDAAIVRIMKARKEMTYEQLKAATIDAVKSHFVPAVDIIKQRIDSLVESDYLERSSEDRTKFLYVA